MARPACRRALCWARFVGGPSQAAEKQDEEEKEAAAAAAEEEEVATLEALSL